MAFRAKFPGQCVKCDEPISEGDLIEWTGGLSKSSYQHAGECPEPVDPLNPHSRPGFLEPKTSLEDLY